MLRNTAQVEVGFRNGGTSGAGSRGLFHSSLYCSHSRGLDENPSNCNRVPCLPECDTPHAMRPTGLRGSRMGGSLPSILYIAWSTKSRAERPRCMFSLPNDCSALELPSTVQHHSSIPGHLHSQQVPGVYWTPITRRCSGAGRSCLESRELPRSMS